MQKAEDLKLLNVSNDSKNDTNSSDDQNDPFFERLAKTIIKNLEVTIANVHIRYEDKQSNPGYPFAAGVTLANLVCVNKAKLYIFRFTKKISKFIWFIYFLGINHYQSKSRRRENFNILWQKSNFEFFFCLLEA